MHTYYVCAASFTSQIFKVKDHRITAQWIMTGWINYKKYIPLYLIYAHINALIYPLNCDMHIIIQAGSAKKSVFFYKLDKQNVYLNEWQ